MVYIRDNLCRVILVILGLNHMLKALRQMGLFKLKPSKMELWLFLAPG